MTEKIALYIWKFPKKFPINININLQLFHVLKNTVLTNTIIRIICKNQTHLVIFK